MTRALHSRPGRLVVGAWLRTYGRSRAEVFELARPAGPVPPSRAAYPPGYVLRRAGRDEAEACSRVTNLSIEETLRRHDAGDTCWVVARGARPAMVIWVHDGPCYVRGLGYLHDGTAGEKYLYGAVTDPSERGKGLFKNGLEELTARLFADGARRLVEIVEAGNTPSLVTVRKLGRRPIRRIESILLLGLRRTIITPIDGGRAERTWRLLPPPDLFVI